MRSSQSALHCQPRSQASTPRLALVVDPDEQTRKLHASVLIPQRYVVEHADEGREALAKAIADPPDVIVTEVALPGLSGYDLCHLLRSDRDTRSVPIIAVTAETSPEVHDRLLKSGVNLVVVKPCDPQLLLSHINTVTQQNEQVRQQAIGEKASTPGRRRCLSHTQERYETTTPPLPLPPMLCPVCLDVLEYERSFIGGVTHKMQEQWDELSCAHGCGKYQYRHRTRKLSRKVELSGSRHDRRSAR
jgi:CheY-like chemotaxis protein